MCAKDCVKAKKREASAGSRFLLGASRVSRRRFSCRPATNSRRISLSNSGEKWITGIPNQFFTGSKKQLQMTRERNAKLLQIVLQRDKKMSRHLQKALLLESLHYLLRPVSIKTFAVALFLLWTLVAAENGKVIEFVFGKHNPCCSMPCFHRGSCTPISESHYECVCPSGYYGRNCDKSTFSRWLGDKLDLDHSTKQKLALTGRLFWGVINNVPLFHNAVLRYLYLSGTDLGGSHDLILHYRHDYDLLGSYDNHSYFARGLPPVPFECPTPLGIKGPVTLPKVNIIFNRLFKRRKFKACPMRSNLMFSTFAQYLAYQFFQADFPKNEKKEFFPFYKTDAKRALRSWRNGKLRVQMINGEEYPPYLKDVPDVPMYYPKEGDKSVFPKWAMSHRMLSITPFMFVMATIWLREHNRVCDIINRVHPGWSDERIYQTAKWIVLGELLTITAGEYFQHLAQYRLKLGYKPQLIHNELISSSKQMQHEFNLAYQWHQMMPDTVCIQGKNYSLSDLTYSNNRIVFEYGLDAIIDFMSRAPAGEITFQNCGKTFEGVMKQLIQEGRTSRLHSFNDYRRFFGLKPYETFEELTGEKKVSTILKDLYVDVDAVEFIVGSFLEKHTGSVAPPTMISLAGPVALRKILNNPVGSAALWRPSTFGGKFGFDIVQKATLKKLFCLNLKGNCKNNVWVSFKTPANAFDRLKRVN